MFFKKLFEKKNKLSFIDKVNALLDDEGSIQLSDSAYVELHNLTIGFEGGEVIPNVGEKVFLDGTYYEVIAVKNPIDSEFLLTLVTLPNPKKEQITITLTISMFYELMSKK